MINYENITIKNLSVLIDTVNRHTVDDIEHIERTYLDNATHFSDNLSFLTTIKLLTVSGRHVLSSSFIKSIDNIQDSQKRKDKLRVIIVEMMFQNRSNKGIEEFWKYCSCFSLDEDGKKLSYMPNLMKRLKQAGIRNFLLELGFVSKVSDKDEYFIADEYAELLTDLFGKVATLTPLRLALIQKKQADLGNKAEKEILAYERRKLNEYPKLAKNIRHVANKNVKAGYDIESFCKKKAEKGISEKIYIEVKAVSAIQKKFYWSVNEIETAKKFKSDYYLYLLPVGLNGQFDIENLKIISNPYKSVYLSDEWQKKEELISVMEKT